MFHELVHFPENVLFHWASHLIAVRRLTEIEISGIPRMLWKKAFLSTEESFEKPNPEILAPWITLNLSARRRLLKRSVAQRLN